jgi:hypothetical protein
MLARYRRAMLAGELRAGTTLEQYRAAVTGQAQPGTPAFGVQARLRQVQAARAPLPSTSAPPLFQEPAKMIKRGAAAAGEAALGGLKIGTGLLVLAAAAGVGYLLWRR